MTGTGRAESAGIQRSIAGRLLFWFLVIALIPCAILTAITARIAATALEASVRDNLVQIAAAKAGEMEAYAGERVRDGSALARGPTFVRAMRELAAVPVAAGAADRRGRLDELGKSFDQYFGYVATAYGYSQMLLIDPEGRVVYSLDDSIPPDTPLTGGSLATSELAIGFDRARTLLQSDLCGFQVYGKAAEPLAFVTCPMFDGGRVIGVVALGLDPERVWRILSDLSGLGATGEIVAGQLAGNAVLVTTPLRHAADAAFRMQIPLGAAHGSATQRAASGERGFGRTVDYVLKHAPCRVMVGASRRVA